MTRGVLAVLSTMKSSTIQAVPRTENMTAVSYRDPLASAHEVLGLTEMAVCNSPLHTEGKGLFFPNCQQRGTEVSLCFQEEEITSLAPKAGMYLQGMGL